MASQLKSGSCGAVADSPPTMWRLNSASATTGAPSAFTVNRQPCRRNQRACAEDLTYPVSSSISGLTNITTTTCHMWFWSFGAEWSREANYLRAAQESQREFRGEISVTLTILIVRCRCLLAWLASWCRWFLNYRTGWANSQTEKSIGWKSTPVP